MTPAEDLFVMDLEALRWSEILIESNNPLQRHGHRCTVTVQGEIWMYGGIDELESSCQNLYKAQLPYSDSSIKAQ